MVLIILRKDFQNLLTRSVFSGIIYSLRNHSVKMCLSAKLHFYTMKPQPFESLYAPLAQLVEQLTLNQWVPGSNP